MGARFTIRHDGGPDAIQVIDSGFDCVVMLEHAGETYTGTLDGDQLLTVRVPQPFPQYLAQKKPAFRRGSLGRLEAVRHAARLPAGLPHTS